MTPIDVRNETWDSLQERVHGLRLVALEAWRKFGPCTTRYCAQVCGMDILMLRPRTTELVQIGLVRLVGRREKEGIYEAVPEWQARRAFEIEKQRALAGHQPELNLK